MANGKVVSIYITATASGKPTAVDKARAVERRGLEGDRYFLQTGTYSDQPGPDREVTLIETEAIESLERDYGLKLDAGDARRNVITLGVPLNDLVGREFRIGEVTLRGIRLCEPCAHLAELTDDRALRGLVHRGGLRAQILNGGMIRVGDRVSEA